MVVVNIRKASNSEDQNQNAGVSQDFSQAKVLEIADNVCNIVKMELGLPEDSGTVTKETIIDEGLVDDGDSIKELEILYKIQEEFGIRFEEYYNYVENITLHDIASLIVEDQQRKEATKSEDTSRNVQKPEAPFEPHAPFEPEAPCKPETRSLVLGLKMDLMIKKKEAANPEYVAKRNLDMLNNAINVAGKGKGI